MFITYVCIYTVDVAGTDSVSLLDSSLFQFSSVAQSCLTLCDPMNRNTPGLPVHHQLPELTQTHVHWVGDAKKMIQWCLGRMSLFIFFLSWWHDITELGSEWLLQSSCTVPHSGPNKQNPLAIICSLSLLGFSVTSSSSCLSSSFLWASNIIRSSLVSSTFASWKFST